MYHMCRTAGRFARLLPHLRLLVPFSTTAANPKVFLTITIDDSIVGDIVCEVS